MEVFLVWVGLSVAVGFFWKSKGRSLGGGIVWSMILSPVVGAIIGAFLKSGLRTCPFCTEKVKPEATVCKHCHRDLPTVQQAFEASLGGGMTVRDFDRADQYVAGEIVSHPEYGRGRIEKVGRDEIIVQFSSGHRSFEGRGI